MLGWVPGAAFGAYSEGNGILASLVIREMSVSWDAPGTNFLGIDARPVGLTADPVPLILGSGWG